MRFRPRISCSPNCRRKRMQRVIRLWRCWLPGAQQHRVDRDPGLRHGAPQGIRILGIDPEKFSGFAFAWAWSAWPCCATA